MIARIFIVSFWLFFLALPARGWEDLKLSAALTVNGEPVPYRVFSVFVLPGGRISIEPAVAGTALAVEFGGQTRTGEKVELAAPREPGISELVVRYEKSGESARINVFTMIPATQVTGDARLNGYRIGKYPDKPLRGLDIYLPPRGFVEVTAENAGTQVSPNFTLGQFLAKQQSDFPKYLVLRSALLLKLERILAELNAAGHPTKAFVVMSGYRTPFYNRAIGNVPYSRHVYGGAADIYIDENPADGRMDDMNGDGKVDRADARWLADFVNDLSKRGLFGPRVGGIGVYGSTSAHGPFVHVDVRGTRARW